VVSIKVLCVSEGYERFRKASFTVCYGVLKSGLEFSVRLCVCVCVCVHCRCIKLHIDTRIVLRHPIGK
jgi:hypothetical protein